MKPVIQIVIHIVIVIRMDGIIVKINDSIFAGEPLESPQGPLRVPRPHFENHWAKIL